MPDEATEITIADGPATTRLRVLVADQTQADGTDWDCCPRTFLRRAISDFRDQTGLRVIATFEHEFVLEGLPPISSVFLAQASRRRSVRTRPAASLDGLWSRTGELVA